jgi:hypothetical protein
MANERITESIVRKHFEKFSKKCLIEEQKSQIPKIDKLLKTASKKGTGKGYPEFIISFSDSSNFVIVIECKADVSKHESNSLDKYSEFAVDGALLYASYLSKEYDVLSIAVSGQSKSHLKISHFLHLKGTVKPSTIFSNKLLDVESYKIGYVQSPEKFKQDYNSLLDFSKELNVELHSKKVKEALRSLLISGILIALENKPFRISYKSHETPEDLANNLANTISSQLKNAKLNSKKLENLIPHFPVNKEYCQAS